MSTEEGVPEKTGDVNIVDLVPCFALCCCIFSMYTVIPDCCGSVFENVICCLGCKLMTCKPSKEAGTMCKLLGADCDCVPFKVCCKGRSQLCCLDSRISFPPTKEIPCLVTCCFLTCFYDYHFLCSCGADVEALDIKMASKVGIDDYDDDDEEGNDRRGKKGKAGSGGKRKNDDRGKWEPIEDPETGKIYYVNTLTQQTQWEKPY